MKTMKLAIVMVAIMLGGTIFYSCQKEQNTNSFSSEHEIALKTEPCCVESLPSTAEQVFYNATFDISITAYNDAENTYITLTRGGGKVMTARYANPGLAITQTTGATIFEALSFFTFSFPNPEGWQCGDEVTFSFYFNGLGGGPSNTLQTGILSYMLKDVCGCEESFSYETSDNLSIMFIYVSDVDLSQASFKFTCPHIQSFAGGPISGINNELNPTVLEWVGDATACVPIVFTLTFEPDCDQNGSGFANIWTDFKVNEVSKKSVTPPIGSIEWPIIKYDCPQ